MVELLDLRDGIPDEIRPLIELDAQYHVEEGDAVAIGIYDDDKAAGAVCAYLTDGAAIIESLYVLPEYRRRGFATEMMYRLSLVLSGMEDIYRMEASFSEESDTGLMELFTYLDFFMEIDEGLGEYTVRIGDMVSSEVLQKARTKGVIPLDDMESAQRKNIISLTYPVSYFTRTGNIDEKLSCVMEDASLFIGHEKDELVMVWADSGDQKMSLMSMLKYCLDRSIDLYGEDTKMRIPYINDVSKKIIEKLAGDAAHPTETVWTARYQLFDAVEEED